MSHPLHIPVMKDEVVAYSAPVQGGAFLDGTFGTGGYSRALLAAGAARVIAIDRDPEAVALGRVLEAEQPGRFSIFEARFSEMETVSIEALGMGALFDGILLDIGVSSMQLDQAERGFSFQQEAALDMRMSRSGETAGDIVNEYAEDHLANIIYQFGEEHKSRRVASAIVRARAEAPIQTTTELAEIVARALRGRRGRTHPATKTFQALRIAVNQELDELKQAIAAAARLLKKGGRLVVVTFHSLEDRIVKDVFSGRLSRGPSVSRHMPRGGPIGELALPFEARPRGAVKPTEDECARNPRARSAKLRCGIRTAHPATADVGGV
ncbi:MAG: 16S rRNA (cytosine(1402)-N(4))-methyltransferase RsmH [Pseudomonadota bacterium]